jgi:hypothetical protein
MQQPNSDAHLRALPLVPRAVEPSDRIARLFRKPEPLTEAEWAEFRALEHDAGRMGL